MLHELGNGQEKQIFAELRIRPEGFEWALDNSGFYMATPFSTDARFMTAGITIVYFYDLASGKAYAGQSRLAKMDWASTCKRCPADLWLCLPPAATTSRRSTPRRRRFVEAPAQLPATMRRTWKAFDVSEDGKTVAYVSSTASKLPQLYRAQLDGDKIVSPVQVTKLNEGLVNGRAYSKTEMIHWKGANEETVEGILYYPTNYEEGKKYPLITAIHGGPQGSDKDLWDESWAYPIQLLTQRGSFVLRPNYHGSNNYGLKWSESICCGKYYDLETPDINAGVDYLIAQRHGRSGPDRDHGLV